MATYAELMAQAKDLMQQAEKARKDELAGVIAEIRSKMEQYGLKPSDLEGAKRSAKAGGTKSAAEPRFRGPKGELWAGGPGRKPEWVREALAAGKSIEDFRI